MVSDNSLSMIYIQPCLSRILIIEYKMMNQLKIKLSSEDKKEVKREKRGIGAIFSSVLPGLITLAVESLTSWIKGKQQRRIHQAVDTMRKTESEVKNTLSQ